MDTTTTRNEDGTYDIVQRIATEAVRSHEQLQLLYWREVSAATLGLARFSRGSIRLFGIWPRLLDFGPLVGDRREIVGGLLARHPYGAISWSASNGEVVVDLQRFAPRLRGPFFRAERRFHDLVGRRFLARVSRAGC